MPQRGQCQVEASAFGTWAGTDEQVLALGVKNAEDAEGHAEVLGIGRHFQQLGGANLHIYASASTENAEYNTLLSSMNSRRELLTESCQ